MIGVAHEVQDPAAWKNLAKMLKARRVALGWFNRNAFIAAHADRLRNDRTIAAIENNERMNYSDEMLALVEIVYQWKPGSIDSVLAGGEPRLLEEGVAVTVIEPPAPSALRLECHFIIERLREDRLSDVLQILRDVETSES